MPSKRRPQVHHGRKPRARTKSISVNKVARSKGANKPRTRTVTIPLSRLSKRSSQARTRALHVKAAMVRDPELSLSHAAKSEGVSVRTIQQYFPTGFKKVAGRWRASKNDTFRETMYIPDTRGLPIPVLTKSFKERLRVSTFLRDLGRYYRGNTSALSAWHGQSISGVSLVTASRTLKSIEAQLADFAIYTTFNGGAE